jgi:hypothetical protein
VNRADTLSMDSHASDVVSSATVMFSCSVSASTLAARFSAAFRVNRAVLTDISRARSRQVWPPRTFALPDPTSKTVTYNTALVPVDAGSQASIEPAGGWDRSQTVATSTVTGLLRDRGYAMHAHTNPCGATGEDARPCYQNHLDLAATPQHPSTDPHTPIHVTRSGSTSAPTRTAKALPHHRAVRDVDGDTYKGRVTTKMGPVKLQFAGTAKIVERDESAKRIVMDASGSEEKGKGQATMKVTSTMAYAEAGHA